MLQRQSRRESRSHHRDSFFAQHLDQPTSYGESFNVSYWKVPTSGRKNPVRHLARKQLPLGVAVSGVPFSFISPLKHCTHRFHVIRGRETCE